MRLILCSKQSGVRTEFRCTLCQPLQSLGGRHSPICTGCHLIRWFAFPSAVCLHRREHAFHELFEAGDIFPEYLVNPADKYPRLIANRHQIALEAHPRAFFCKSPLNTTAAPSRLFPFGFKLFLLPALKTDFFGPEFWLSDRFYRCHHLWTFRSRRDRRLPWRQFHAVVDNKKTSASVRSNVRDKDYAITKILSGAQAASVAAEARALWDDTAETTPISPKPAERRKNKNKKPNFTNTNINDENTDSTEHRMASFVIIICPTWEKTRESLRIPQRERRTHTRKHTVTQHTKGTHFDQLRSCGRHRLSLLPFAFFRSGGGGEDGGRRRVPKEGSRGVWERKSQREREKQTGRGNGEGESGEGKEKQRETRPCSEGEGETQIEKKTEKNTHKNTKIKK